MFYERLCELCNEKGIAPTTFVETILKMSKGNCTKWEAGAEPKSNTLKKIANYFDVSTDYLVGNTDIKNKPTTDISDELTQDGLRIAKLASLLSVEQQKRVEEYIEFLNSKDKK